MGSAAETGRAVEMVAELFDAMYGMPWARPTRPFEAWAELLDEVRKNQARVDALEILLTEHGIAVP